MIAITRVAAAIVAAAPTIVRLITPVPGPVPPLGPRAADTFGGNTPPVIFTGSEGLDGWSEAAVAVVIRNDADRLDLLAVADGLEDMAGVVAKIELVCIPVCIPLAVVVGYRVGEAERLVLMRLNDCGGVTDCVGD